MESIPLFFQGSSTTTVGAPELREGRQSLQDADVTGFSALLASLLVPVQPLPDSLAALTAQAEGPDLAVASSNTEAAPEAETVSLLVAPPVDLRTGREKDAPEADAITTVSTGKAVSAPGSRDVSSTDSPVIATSIIKVKDSIPVENRGKAHGPRASEDAVPRLLPDSGVLLRIVPVPQGSAPEPRFRLETVQQAAVTQGSEVKETPVKVISVPLSAIDNGRITLPVQLPSGEQVTLVLQDMPDTASVRTGESPAIMARAAKPAEFIVGNSRPTAAPEAPREAAPVVRQEQQAPVSGPISGEIIRIVLQVKPSETGQEATKTSQALPVESPLQAAAGEAGKATPPARPAVLSSQVSETSQFRGAVESRTILTDQPDRTDLTDPSVNRPEPVKAGSAPEIRVLNQSSRAVSVEVVVQQGSPTEVEGAQAASQPAGRTIGEKTSIVEVDAREVKLPGKPEKTAILADAITGKEAISAISTPAGSVERLPDQPTQSTREVTTDTIIDQVMQKFSPANRHIPSEVTVKLQPEHLGNLQMKVSVEGDQVALKIQVESPVAKQMLENNLGQLRDSFGNIGLRMDSVSVSLGMNTGWDRGHTPLWQEGRGHNAYNMRHNEPEPGQHESSGNLTRAYPVRVDRLLDMTI